MVSHLMENFGLLFEIVPTKVFEAVWSQIAHPVKLLCQPALLVVIDIILCLKYTVEHWSSTLTLLGQALLCPEWISDFKLSQTIKKKRFSLIRGVNNARSRDFELILMRWCVTMETLSDKISGILCLNGFARSHRAYNGAYFRNRSLRFFSIETYGENIKSISSIHFPMYRSSIALEIIMDPRLFECHTIFFDLLYFIWMQGQSVELTINRSTVSSWGSLRFCQL